MNESTNNSREITLLDVLKVLKSRVKSIICIALIAVLVGGVAGAALALVNNATYGARAQFYITSKEANTYILSLLRSDSFAESLLLDENGLPSDKANTDEYAALLAKKHAVEELELQKEEKEILLAKFPTKISNAQRSYQTAQAEYESLCTTIFMNGGVVDEEAYKNATAKRDAASAAYFQAMNDSQLLEEEIADLALKIVKEKEDIKKDTNVLLTDFRLNEDNQAKIDKIKDSVSYQYAETDVPNNSQASLTVKVAVKFDRALAEEIVPKINEKLPDFVEESIISDKEDEEVKCTVISLASEVGSSDYKNPITQAIKLGVVFFVAGVALSIAFFIIRDLFIVPQTSALKEKEETKE